MEIYPYVVKLIDPLFYSYEALSGAFTPAYIHATAINHAVAWAMGRAREDQSYIISEATGGRNIPRYTHSWIEPDFYFTPASLKGDVDYMVEMVKGDMDYFIQPGFGQARIMGKSIGRNEVLKAYRLFSLPPESQFSGYLYAEAEKVESIPRCIRLGSFRGKAELEIKKAIKTFRVVSEQYVDHPVDPLISFVKRGVMIGMFPYPIVDSALVSEVYEIRKHGEPAFVAVPSRPVTYDEKVLLNKLRELKLGLKKAKEPAISLKDRAYLILYTLRSILSIKLLLQGISGEERLNNELKKIEEIESLRLASKGIDVEIEEVRLLRLVEMSEELIDGCEEKISGKEKGKRSIHTEGCSRDIIL